MTGNHTRVVDGEIIGGGEKNGNLCAGYGITVHFNCNQTYIVGHCNSIFSSMFVNKYLFVTMSVKKLLSHYMHHSSSTHKETSSIFFLKVGSTCL